MSPAFRKIRPYFLLEFLVALGLILSIAGVLGVKSFQMIQRHLFLHEVKGLQVQLKFWQEQAATHRSDLLILIHKEKGKIELEPWSLDKDAESIPWLCKKDYPHVRHLLLPTQQPLEKWFITASGRVQPSGPLLCQGMKSTMQATFTVEEETQLN